MRGLYLFALLLLFATGGCLFSRQIVNPHVRDLDTSWVKPGITTRAEIVDRLGLPPISSTGEGGISEDSFRWRCHDSFTGTLEVGYIVTPTFELARSWNAEDILIKFDEEGVVCFISRTISNHNSCRLVQWEGEAK